MKISTHMKLDFFHKHSMNLRINSGDHHHAATTTNTLAVFLFLFLTLQGPYIYYIRRVYISHTHDKKKENIQSRFYKLFVHHRFL